MHDKAIEFSLPEDPKKRYRITDPRFGKSITKFAIPDGRVFEVTLWITDSNNQIRPMNAVPVAHEYLGRPTAEIAKRFNNCCIAESF
jgi:hypothetical protein